MSPRWSLCLPLLATIALAQVASAQPADPYVETPAAKAPPAATSAAPPAPPPAPSAVRRPDPGAGKRPCRRRPRPARPRPRRPPSRSPTARPRRTRPRPRRTPRRGPGRAACPCCPRREGLELEVDGKDTMVLGMNWGYSPIGTNYSYSFWTKSDAFITRVLDREIGHAPRHGR